MRSAALRSAASGASSASRSPVRGCANAMRAACRNCRADERRRPAVDPVADDRVADRGEVHADLVRAPRLRPRLDQRRARRSARRRVRRHRTRAPPSTTAMRWRSRGSRRDRRVDHALRAASACPRRARRTSSRRVRSLSCARQRVVRGVVLRDEDHARRVAVEPVHDARPQHAADAREIVAVREDRVHQRRRRVPRRRMHRHARRLVDREQVGVLVEHVERDRLGLRRRLGAGGGTSTRDALPRLEPQRRLGRARRRRAIRAVVDQPLHPRARQRRHAPRDEHVEPLARRVGDELSRLRAWRCGRRHRVADARVAHSVAAVRPPASRKKISTATMLIADAGVGDVERRERSRHRRSP